MSLLRRRIRILIVDDSAVMRSLPRSVLASDPALEVVATAADGETALAAIATQHPDLVLLDVEMPVMDGLLTLRRMRARGDCLPVIMCSSLTQRGARVTIEALAAGASDYVSKPEGQASRTTGASTLAQELLPRIHALADTETRSPISFSTVSLRLPVGVPIPGPRTPIFNSPPLSSRHRSIHQKARGTRCSLAGLACEISPSRPDRSAHARVVYHTGPWPSASTRSATFQCARLPRARPFAPASYP